MIYSPQPASSAIAKSARPEPSMVRGWPAASVAAPKALPAAPELRNAARRKALYATSCAACRGATGALKS